MDLLPLPQRPIRAFSEIQCLCGLHEPYPYTYDNRGWLNFPERMGRDKDDLYATHADSESIISVKRSLLQAWLFFGLLIDFLDQDVDQETFVEYRNGQRVVAWKRVLEQLSIWTRKVQSSDGVSNKRLKLHLDALSREARQHVRSFCNSTFDETASPLQDDVSLSILLLASLLELAKANVSAHLPIPLRIQAMPPKSLLATLSNQNWCPSDIARMRSTLGSLLATYYLSLIGPSRPELQHSNCDTRRCKSYQVKEESYQQRHAAECACHNMMQLDIDHISSLILKNEVPLALAQTPQFDRFGLELVTLAERTTGFVAISHVWSDGLGNPMDNSLPRCQVQRLQHWCDELFPYRPTGQSIPFWMDTLCIPRAGPAKKLAISSMTKVYGLATAVLVIDKDLLETPRNVTDLELVARIYSCGWLRRVWTLQEGVKARSLYFRLRDGFLNLETIIRRISSRLTGDVDFDPSHQLAWEFLKPLIAFEEISANSSRGLGAAISSVQFRDATNAGDDLVCIDGILGWEEKDVQRVAPDPTVPTNLQPLQVFLLRQSSIPSDILFLGGCRMTDPGWRWAPAELAEQRAYQISGPLTSKVTAHGLYGTYHGIQVAPIPQNKLQNAFMLYDQSYGVWLVVKDNSATDTGSLHIQDVEYRPGVSKADWIDGLRRPALLLQNKLPRVGGTSSTVGVLVNVEFERDGVIHAQFCGSVAFDLLPTETVQQFEGMKVTFGGLQGLVNEFKQLVRLGNGVKDGQKWCIS